MNALQHLQSCIVCSAPTCECFSKNLEEAVVHYSRCPSCGHLTADELTTPVKYEGDDYFNDVDTGWKDRNQVIFRLIRCLLRSSSWFRLSSRSVILDYGCGVGRLVEDLRLAGIDAWGFEPYVTASGPGGRILKSWKQVTQTIGTVDLLTCIEVLEHLRDPDGFLGEASRLIRADGYILISTGIFRRSFHRADWYYLNPAAGHVSIFTESSLRVLLARHKFDPVLRASELVWLFRKTGTEQRRAAERGLFEVSQIRTKSKVKTAELARRILGASWQPPELLHRVWSKL